MEIVPVKFFNRCRYTESVVFAAFCTIVFQLFAELNCEHANVTGDPEEATYGQKKYFTTFLPDFFSECFKKSKKSFKKSEAERNV